MKFTFRNCEIKGVKIDTLRFGLGDVAPPDWWVRKDFPRRPVGEE